MGQLLWLIVIVVPLLGVALMGSPTDPGIMKKPLGKNQFVFSAENLVFVLWCYGLKFLPLILVVLACFGGILSSHCMEICEMYNCTCVLYYAHGASGAASGDLVLIRHFVILVIFVNLLVISMGFVHREHLIWQKGPHRNVLWISTIFFL